MKDSPTKGLKSRGKYLGSYRTICSSPPSYLNYTGRLVNSEINLHITIPTLGDKETFVDVISCVCVRYTCPS